MPIWLPSVVLLNASSIYGGGGADTCSQVQSSLATPAIVRKLRWWTHGNLRREHCWARFMVADTLTVQLNGARLSTVHDSFSGRITVAADSFWVRVTTPSTQLVLEPLTSGMKLVLTPSFLVVPSVAASGVAASAVFFGVTSNASMNISFAANAIQDSADEHIWLWHD